MPAGGLAIAGAAVLLSACSSGPSAAPATTTTRPSTGTATGTSTRTASTTSSSTTPSSSSTTGSDSSSTTGSTTGSDSSSTTTCQLSGLRLAEVGQGGAAGTQEVTFSLTNVSTAPCGTYGYPGMLLVGTAGASLPTVVDRGGSLAFEDVEPTRVTLASGQSAYFNVGFNDVQAGTTTCSSTHSVEVTPPTNTTHATVGVPLGIDACDDGTLHVSAVFASTSAAATQTTAPS